MDIASLFGLPCFRQAKYTEINTAVATINAALVAPTVALTAIAGIDKYQPYAESLVRMNAMWFLDFHSHEICA